jgi:tetratricopeptide (TPR) repeat protein
MPPGDALTLPSPRGRGDAGGAALAPSLTHGLNLGSTLYELNRLEEAERVLRDVLVLDPRSVDAKELLATVLTGQDRYDEAIKIASRDMRVEWRCCIVTGCLGRCIVGGWVPG